jgi:multiple sugar transport system permease protein
MSRFKSFFEKRIKFFLILPLLLLLVFFAVFPAIYTYYISAHKTLLSNYQSPPFNGLANYLATLKDRDAFKALLFSIKYSFAVTITELVLGLGLAVLFNKKVPGKRVAMSFLLLPMMISPALLGIMFRLMLNEFVGLVTYYLDAIGLPGSDLLGPDYIFFTLVGIDVIQWTSFVFIILYAALQTMPEELQEAALVDGANRFQIFRYITLPFIMPFIVITSFLRWIDSFKVFDMIQVMTGGGPGTLTTSVSIYIYKMAFNTSDFGRAAATSVLLLFLLTIPLVIALRHIGRES